MGKLKFIIGGFSVIALIGIVYLIGSATNLNAEEVYYGKVDEKRKLTTIYSEDDQHDFGNTDNNKEFKSGDFVKVVYTDNKGVIVETKKVQENDIPKEIRNKIN
ncbi:hypothetical protein [Staphylococcus ratti]|uniref:DUF1093 domain-containing protein n=1 Tax=Staphylococcus ratti TaxID=2892440 RepID=A0ABY3PAD2_9STAP|nr:hypothetical protein [Staphylococcus ratti]UEX89265.1 hypothetical protein LN051_06675 [Staphylococcus ratti]